MVCFMHTDLQELKPLNFYAIDHTTYFHRILICLAKRIFLFSIMITDSVLNKLIYYI